MPEKIGAKCRNNSRTSTLFVKNSEFTTSRNGPAGHAPDRGINTPYEIRAPPPVQRGLVMFTILSWARRGPRTCANLDLSHTDPYLTFLPWFGILVPLSIALFFYLAIIVLVQESMLLLRGSISADVDLGIGGGCVSDKGTDYEEGSYGDHGARRLFPKLLRGSPGRR